MAINKIVIGENKARLKCTILGQLNGYGSEAESANDTGDEDLLGAVIRSAASSPATQRRPSRDKRRQSIDRSTPCKFNS